MKIQLLYTILSCFFLLTCKEDKQSVKEVTPDSQSKTIKSLVDVHPISHGTLVLNYKNVTAYIDPVGGAEAFIGQKKPTLILITDIHGDHLNIETLKAITTKSTKIIAPIAVAKKTT